MCAPEGKPSTDDDSSSGSNSSNGTTPAGPGSVATCADGCSGNGECVEGSCYCNTGMAKCGAAVHGARGGGGGVLPAVLECALEKGSMTRAAAAASQCGVGNQGSRLQHLGWGARVLFIALAMWRASCPWRAADSATQESCLHSMPGCGVQRVWGHEKECGY
jgi:hypothetical protein